MSLVSLLQMENIMQFKLANIRLKEHRPSAKGPLHIDTDNGNLTHNICTSASTTQPRVLQSNPTDHVSHHDLQIVNNTYLRNVITKDPTCKSIHLKHDFKVLMESVRGTSKQ